MNDLPAPLTPPECDLRGLPYMPVDIVRLLDSDLYIQSTGDEFKAAVSLWCKAFFQVPAASLPDDDRALAHLSGAGANWPKVRAMALHGFVRCLDGRLYHPVVAERALDAWGKRTAYRARTRAATEARKARRSDRDDAATDNVANDADDNVTTNVMDNVTVCSNGTKGEREGTEERRKESKIDRPADSKAARGVTGHVPESDPLGTGIVGMKPDPVSGRAMVGGWDIAVVFDRCCEAAGINPFTTQETWKTTAGWLNADLDADDIVGVIRRIASRPGTTRAKSLKFFDSAVRADCKPTGMLAKMQATPEGIGSPGVR